MKRYIFEHRWYPHNQITIEAENEEKAIQVFMDIFGSLKDYRIIQQE
jgi:hypothetical protein